MNKRLRIKKNEEFSEIISYRHSKAGKTFIVYYEDRKKENARVGISVSKKLGNAVVRNRIKRQVREVLRALMDFDSYARDLVVIVRKPYLEQSFSENKNDLEKMLKQVII